MLGVVETDHKSFVLAEIPGLIAGAHQGKGLGHEFLRHALRTRVLLHLIDGGSAEPVADMLAVNNELFLFDPSLADRPQIVAVNKIDRPDVDSRTAEIKKMFREAGISVSFISAASGQGVKELMSKIAEALESAPEPDMALAEELPDAYHPQNQPPRGVSVSLGGQCLYLLPGRPWNGWWPAATFATPRCAAS